MPLWKAETSVQSHRCVSQVIIYLKMHVTGSAWGGVKEEVKVKKNNRINSLSIYGQHIKLRDLKVMASIRLKCLKICVSCEEHTLGIKETL